MYRILKRLHICNFDIFPHAKLLVQFLNLFEGEHFELSQSMKKIFKLNQNFIECTKSST